MNREEEDMADMKLDAVSFVWLAIVIIIAILIAQWLKPKVAVA